MYRIARAHKIATALMFVLFLVLAGPVAQPAFAQVFSHQQIRVDDSIAIDDAAYSIPTKIIVLPLFPPDTSYSLSDTDWFRGLYYYSIANDRRAGFTDIPFHYVVSGSGEVFKGNSGGGGAKD